MNRRTAISLSFGAIAQQVLGQPVANAYTTEQHQIGLLLLLIDDNTRKSFFNNSYNSGTYASTVFGKHKIDGSIFQKAQSAYPSDTQAGLDAQKSLTDMVTAFRNEINRISGGIYPPPEPCPKIDANKNVPVVLKLTA